MTNKTRELCANAPMYHSSKKSISTACECARVRVCSVCLGAKTTIMKDKYTDEVGRPDQNLDDKGWRLSALELGLTVLEPVAVVRLSNTGHAKQLKTTVPSMHVE